MIKAIFFDTTGTLYQSTEYEAEANVKTFELIAKVKNVTQKEAEELFRQRKKELKQKQDSVTKTMVIESYGASRDDFQNALGSIDATKYVSQDEELVQMLERLSKKYKLGVITNCGRLMITNIFDAIGFGNHFFDYLITSADVNRSKPYPDPFKKAIEISGVNPTECVYVGDSLRKDMRPAKKEGFQTVWVNNESKEDESVNVIINSIYKIEEIVKMI